MASNDLDYCKAEIFEYLSDMAPNGYTAEQLFKTFRKQYPRITMHNINMMLADFGLFRSYKSADGKTYWTIDS
jgi:hypothetical protein